MHIIHALESLFLMPYLAQFSSELGLSIDSGLHIKRIEPGSIAAEDETLSIGDKILIVSNPFFISN